MIVVAPKRPDTELAHLAWCILVSVRLARREGKAVTAMATHIFIMQWLANAQKRKLFPKAMAADILWLQAQGKRYGVASRLYSKVEYIWLASSGELTSQSELFKFTCMIDTLRTMGWQDYLLSDVDWRNGWTAGATVSGIYTQKSSLHSSFSQQGDLLTDMDVRVTGDASGLQALFEQCGLKTECLQGTAEYGVFRIIPDGQHLTSKKKVITEN